MLKQHKKWRNESGMALVIAILITSALVAVGSFAMVMTNTELDISRNDRFSKEAFFFTDGGGSIFTRIIDEIYFNNNLPAYADITIDTNFINEILNYRTDDLALNDSSTDSPSNNPDITFSDNGNTLNVDIDWRIRVAGPGGSLLTHMGYEGIGVNKSFGGVQIYFDVRSVGSSSRFARSQVNSVYRR